MKIIGDPGSCHLGNLTKAKELIRIGKEAGLDAVKFQLLTDKESINGNIKLPWEWMPELIDYGKGLNIEVFASVFGQAGADWMCDCGVESIKYSYSQRNNADLPGPFKTVYISRDVMDPGLKGPNVVNLFCIPEYPVRYLIDWEGIFPLFDGFSSHTLGIAQDLAAVRAGATVLEKHFQAPWDSPCPDGRFALRPEALAELCRKAREIADPYKHMGPGPNPAILIPKT